MTESDSVMDVKRRIDATGALFLVAFSALLGLNQVMIKWVNIGMQPIFQAGLRSACSFIPILVFAMLTRKRLSVTDGSAGPGLVCGLLFSVEFLLLFQALDYTSVARASVLFYTMPVWVALAAHFLINDEKLTVTRSLGLGLAFIGVVVALAHNHAPVSDAALIGDLMCLAAAGCWAGVAILVRTTRFGKASPEMQLLYQLGVSAVVLLPVAPIFGDVIRDITPEIVGIFLIQVFVVVCVGFVVWFWVLSIYRTSDMTSFSFLAPIFGVFFGWTLLNEAISWNVIVALVLVGAGIVLINRKPGIPSD